MRKRKCDDGVILRTFLCISAGFLKRIHTFAEPSQLQACRLQANYKNEPNQDVQEQWKVERNWQRRRNAALAQLHTVRTLHLLRPDRTGRRDHQARGQLFRGGHGKRRRYLRIYRGRRHRLWTGRERPGQGCEGHEADHGEVSGAQRCHLPYVRQRNSLYYWTTKEVRPSLLL